MAKEKENAAQAQQENNELQLATIAGAPSSMMVFGSAENFETAQRMANCLSNSSIIPTAYQKKPENCLIALDMANRMGANPIMVMQNLYIVHGNPGWSSKFLIACLNQCGKFSPLRYEFEGEEGTDDWSCYAYAIDKKTGETLKGGKVSIKTAKAEGWYQKEGSKWKTIPQLMLMYRAAAFFQRVYAPEISMGFMTSEEIEDVEGRVIETRPISGVKGAGAGIAQRLNQLRGEEIDPDPENPEQEQEQEQEQKQEPAPQPAPSKPVQQPAQQQAQQAPANSGAPKTLF